MMRKLIFKGQRAEMSGAHVALVMLTGLTAGVEAAAPPDWTGEGELGIVGTSGNTENRSINAKAKGVYTSDPWRHTALFEAYNNADAIRTTAERYLLSAKSDRKTSDFNYFFGLVTYESDRFSGYDYHVSESVGFGRRIIETPKLTLDLEVGPGGRQSKRNDGQSENEMMIRLAGDLKWKLSDSAEFSETVSTEIGEDSTVTKSVTALKARIVGALAMKLAFAVRNVTDGPAGTKETDTETALTLVYAF